jgi:superfamily I DNA/RNA helicase
MESEIVSGLNEEQKKALLETEGAVLVTAGAGSGKTRLLTHRISYLIQEKDVNPYNMVAITFTNKAAKEMKERCENLLKAEIEFGFRPFTRCVQEFYVVILKILLGTQKISLYIPIQIVIKYIKRFLIV